MKKLIILCIIAITLTVGGLIALRPDQAKDRFTDDYPYARTIYIDVCIDSYSSKQTCACTYEYMDIRLTNAEFQKMLNGVFTNKKTDIVSEAAKNCYSKEN